MTTLRPWVGAFGREEVRHLVNRAAFGAPTFSISRFLGASPSSLVDLLLTGRFDGQLRFEEYLRLRRIVPTSFEQLRALFVRRAVQGSDVLQRRMTLILHSHFATAFRKVRHLEFMDRHLGLLERHALGDFRALLLALCDDPALMIWLDGDGSTRARPNENFAREFLELFTLGRGNYDEGDVKEAARVFTGRRVDSGGVHRLPNERDDGPKKVLGALIGDEADLVDLVLNDPRGCRHVAVKLASPFLGPEVAAAKAEDLAACWRHRKFLIGEFLRDVLCSELMFSVAARRRRPRSPLEFVIGSMRAVLGRGDFEAMARSAAAMGQSYGDPPSVAGWPSGRDWLTTATIAARQRFAIEVGLGRKGPLGLRMPVSSPREDKDLSFAILGLERELDLPADAAFQERVGRLLACPEAQLI